MKHSEDLIGQVFGELTVIRRISQGNNGGSSWECICSCGRMAYFEGNRLLSGHNKRCGKCSYGVYNFLPDGKVELLLPKGKKFVFDFVDYPIISQYKWSIDKQGYPKTADGKYLHQLIMNPQKGMVVDHIDMDKSNNCRSNLRICLHSQNLQNTGVQKNNTSGFKGVSFDKYRNKWSAHITVDGKHHYLGRYDTPEEAAEEYDKAASLFFGEYARTNEMIRKGGKK